MLDELFPLALWKSARAAMPIGFGRTLVPGGRWSSMRGSRSQRVHARVPATGVCAAVMETRAKLSACRMRPFKN